MKNKYFIIAIFVILFGLGVRLFYCIKYPVPVRDSYEYFEYIIKWREGGAVPIYRFFPPFAMYLFKTVDEITSLGLTRSAIIINVIVGELLIYLVIHIASKYKLSTLNTLFLGILAATHPTLIHYSSQPLRENIYLLFCSLFAISFVNYIQSHKFIDVVCQAFFCSLALLTRKESLELVFLPVIVLMFNIKNTPIYVIALRAIAYFSIIAIMILLFQFMLQFDFSYLLGYFNKLPQFS